MKLRLQSITHEVLITINYVQSTNCARNHNQIAAPPYCFGRNKKDQAGVRNDVTLAESRNRHCEKVRDNVFLFS